MTAPPPCAILRPPVGAKRRGPNTALCRRHTPAQGLSVPVITVVDEAGALIEADQRALVRYVIQDGYGADVVFAAGPPANGIASTTGCASA